MEGDGDRQARCDRTGGGREAGRSATGADASVGHDQVDGGGWVLATDVVRRYRWTGACCRHGCTGARAEDGHGEHGEDDGPTSRRVDRLTDRQAS